MFIALFLTILTSFWFWRIIDNNFILGILLVIDSFLIYKMIFLREETTRGLHISILSFFIIIFLIQLKAGYYWGIWVFSPTERIPFDNRHNYLSSDLGPLYQNKASTFFYTKMTYQLTKYNQNIFYNLDPNLYFFASHPLERQNVDEFNKYSPFVLPLFLIGIIGIFKTGAHFFAIAYGLVIIFASGFVQPNYISGPVLFFPVINSIIAKGLVVTFSFVKKRFKNSE